MNDLSSKILKERAKACLASASYDPKRLILIYGLILLGGNLLGMVLNYITGYMVETAGGLSGLGTRAILNTVSTVFNLVVSLLSPFLTMSIYHLAIRWARQKDATPSDLLVGIRRWGTVLLNALFIGLIVFCVMYLSIQIASIVFTFTATGKHAITVVSGMMEDPAVLEGNISNTMAIDMLKAMLPVYILSAALFLLLFIPLSYRLRLSFFRLMDESPTGPVKSVSQSRKLMKGNCMALFKLDLSFWWYYLIQTLLSVGAMVAALLPGVSDAGYLGIYCVYTVVMLAWEYCFLGYLQTTYALFYTTVLSGQKPQEQPQLPQ